MFPSEKYDLSKLAHDNQQKSFITDSGNFENIYFDFNSLNYHNLVQGTNIQSGDIKKTTPLSALGLVKDFSSRVKNLNGEKIQVYPYDKESHVEDDQKMSTNARIRMAGQHFIDFYSSKADEISDLSHPFPISFSGLSEDAAKDVELLITLLYSAEKTSQGKCEQASKLIELCNNTSSNEGNPVQRLVHYFSQAIMEKINREMGKVAKAGLDNMCDLEDALMNVEECLFLFYRRVPFAQVCQFSSMRTIIEHVKESKKIHVVDFGIRTGMQYTVLMQGLASECEIEHLKITAVATRLEAKIKDACNKLAEFAETLNIPFSFKIVMIEDMLDFNVNLLELNDDEQVAVYIHFQLSSLIVRSKVLERLMREIRKINPCITLISEVEANHTSPEFVKRFIEALFFYGALFDSMSDNLADDDFNRKAMESVFYGQSITNIVAAEGEERTVRHVCIDVWRAFFSRFGMLEVELSDASLDEAKLLINNLNCGCCMLRVDGKCFLVGWKGVPIFSVSAWKFV
uniref:DELLA protein GAI1-like n=1 Tax=Erigeron canadensis TaxID=72917 RepID=UPI001CB88FA7|nr:DELLA protein GAI1-like [Erigeron canadensis]